MPTHIRLLASLVLLLCAFCAVHAQTNLTAQYKFLRDDKGDHLVVSGHTDFPTQTLNLTGTAKSSSGNTTNVAIPPPTLNPTVDPNTLKVTGATFSDVIDFGTGKPLTADMASLTLDVSAQPPAPPAGSAAAVTSRMFVDMQFVREYFSKLDDLARLQRLNVTLLPAPNISAVVVTTLDRSIILHVNSDQTSRVKASAFVRGTPSTSVVSSSSEKEVPGGGQSTLRIDNLTPGTDYDVLVKETGATPGRNPVSFPVVSDLTGQPLKTRPIIPTPVVSFIPGASLKVVNNRLIKIPLTASNAPRVRMTLEAQGVSGAWTEVEPASISTVTSNTGENPSITLQLQRTVMNPQVSYRLKVEGLTQFDEAEPGPSILSNTFNGLSPLLAQAVDFEFTKDGIKFTANTNNVPAKLEVKVGSAPQTFTYSTSTSAGNPSFVLPLALLQTAVGATPDTDFRLPLAIGVKADDGSEREQTLAIALKISRAEISAKPQAAKDKITGFVQDIRSGTDFAPNQGKSIKVGDIAKTGLSLLLRFLMPIP